VSCVAETTTAVLYYK